MTVAVLGPGGVGGVVAVRSGALVVATERSVAAIRERGLRLDHAGLTTVSRPEAVERLDRPVSLLVVAVKAYDLEAALDRIPAGAVEGAVILSLLNGLEQVDRLRRWRGERISAWVAAGSIGRLEADSPEPGIVIQRTAADPVITAASGELDRPRLDAALGPLRVRGLEVVLADDEPTVVWEKAARLAVLAAATVASGRSVGVLRADTDWRHRLRSALEEAVVAAAANGVPLSLEGQWAVIESLPRDLVTSTARDAAAGHSTELDAITGSVVRAAERVGVATPSLTELLEEARCRAR